MKTKLFITILMLLSIYNYTNADKKVELKGKTFTEITTSSKDTTNKGTDTGYTYVYKGKSYNIYKSKNNKYYIIIIAKTSGKPYRKYLPEVAEQLNK